MNLFNKPCNKMHCWGWGVEKAVNTADWNVSIKSNETWILYDTNVIRLSSGTKGLSVRYKLNPAVALVFKMCCNITPSAAIFDWDLMSSSHFYRAFELRLAERVSNGLKQVSLADDSEPQRTALGGLRRQGKKGTVGTKRTGNATLCK